MNLSDLLVQCITSDASDVHLSSGMPPILRGYGVLIPVVHSSLLQTNIIHQALLDIKLPVQRTV
jgi:Tfp pilus assembly pilus retraction ATPase PilT